MKYCLARVENSFILFFEIMRQEFWPSKSVAFQIELKSNWMLTHALSMALRKVRCTKKNTHIQMILSGPFANCPYRLCIMGASMCMIEFSCHAHKTIDSGGEKKWVEK